MATNLSKKIAQLPLEKQQEMLQKVLQDSTRYRLHPLSPQQNRMWFLYNFNPEDASYISRFRFVIKGEVEKNILDQIMKELLNNHKILRTVYLEIEGIPFQTWEDLPSFTSKYIDGREMQEVEIDRQCLEIIHIDSEIPIKAWFVRFKKESWYIWNIHHIVHDGWSIGLLLKEFCDRYEALTKNEVFRDFREKEYNYFDYIKELKMQESELCKIDKISYWKNYFGDCLTGLSLERMAQCESEAENIYLVPDMYLEVELNKLARKERTSVFNILLSVWMYLLEIYNEGENVNVGMPVLNRQSARQLQTIGYFANTIVMKSQNDNRESYFDYLHDVTNRMLNHLQNADIPFEWLVNELRVPRMIDNNPLFNVMFSMQGKTLMKNGMGKSREIAGNKFSFSPYYSRYRTTNFMLMLTVVETEKGLSMGFSYDNKYFNKLEVIQMREDYIQTLKKIIKGVNIFEDTYKKQIGLRFRKNTLVRNSLAHDNIHTEESKTEQKLREIWADILGHHQFTVTQAFFEVGGNSINCFQLLKKLNDNYPIEFKISQLFEYKSIYEMAAFIEKQLGKKETTCSVRIQMF